MPPLVLDDERSVAIAVGCGRRRHALAGVDEASLRALAKLEQVLPAGCATAAASLSGARPTRPLTSGDGATIAPETLTVMASTVAGHERLRFAYRAADAPVAAGDRAVPLVSTGRRWYSWRTTSTARTGGRSASTG
ncbi:hypothetical protein GCM10023238_15550 [Streptomyces heliomycini]